MNEYNRGDCCYATVTGHNGRGSYLTLDNGQRAFAYSAGNIRVDAKVLCTVAREAVPGKNILVRLDSICDLYEACA